MPEPTFAEAIQATFKAMNDAPEGMRTPELRQQVADRFGITEGRLREIILQGIEGRVTIDDRLFCASSPEAAAMSDGEFWENIEASRHGMTPEQMRNHQWEPDEDDYEPTLLQQPCPLCGCIEACHYDSEGRPMIHSIPADFDG